MAGNKGLILGAVALVVVVVLVFMFMGGSQPAAQVAPGSNAQQGAVALAPGAVATPAVVVKAPGAAPVVITACDYDFAQGVDSGGNDIKNVGALPLDQLKKICDTTAGCKGFNNNGWLKHTLNPQNTWSKWTDEAGKGFYYKRNPACQV